MKLTEQRRKFADEYIISGKATQSYLIAYLNVKKESTARANVSRLLTNANVKAYVDARLNELKRESIAEQDESLQFLTSTMRGEITEPVLIFVGEGVRKVKYLPTNVRTRRQAGLDMLKRYDVLPKTKFEIQKHEKN